MVQFVSLLALIISLGILFVIHIQRIKERVFQFENRIWEYKKESQTIHLSNISETQKISNRVGECLDKIKCLEKSRENILNMIGKITIKEDNYQLEAVDLSRRLERHRNDQIEFVRLLSEYRQQTLLLAEALGVEFVPEKTETFKPKFVKRKHG